MEHGPTEATRYHLDMHIYHFFLKNNKGGLDEIGPLKPPADVLVLKQKTQSCAEKKNMFFYPPFLITLIRLNMQVMYHESDSSQPAAARKGERGINNFLHLDDPPPPHHHPHHRHRHHARSPSASND